MISFTTEDVCQRRLLGDLIGWPFKGRIGHVDVFEMAGVDSFASLQGSASLIIINFLWGLATRIVWILILHEVLFDVRESTCHSMRFIPLNLIEIITDGNGLPPLLVTIILIEIAAKPLINGAFDMVFELYF